MSGNNNGSFWAHIRYEGMFYSLFHKIIFLITLNKILSISIEI